MKNLATKTLIASVIAAGAACSADAGVVLITDTANFTTNPDPNAIVRPGPWTFTNAQLNSFVGGGADMIVVAFASENGGDGSNNPVTYAGQAMTKIEFGAGARDAAIYVLENPAADGDLVFNYGPGNGVGGTIFALIDTGLGIEIGQTGLSAGGSDTLNGVNNGSLIIAAAARNQGTPPAAQSPMTPTFSSGSGSSAVGTGYQYADGTSATSSFSSSPEFVASAEFYSIVPEPGSLTLLGLGGLCLARRRRG